MPMVKNPFNGQLNTNIIFSAIFNVIISQLVFADNIKGTYGSLVDRVRTDGTLYGDTKLFYATDVLKSHAWGNDAEAANLLSLDRPPAPACQAIVLDQFRQIRLTVDNYLTKQAFADEYAFSSFNTVMLGWMGETKKVYDSTLINAYFGTVITGANKNTINIDLGDTSGHPLYQLTGVEKEKMEAMLIAQGLADLFVDMKDVTRDYNDYQFLRSYSLDDLYVVWNSKFVNKIRKVDLPTIFHKDGLVDKFDEEILPARYFGTVITSSNISTYSDSTPAAGKPIDSDTNVYTPGVNHANGCIRSLVEKDVTVSATLYHVFPGDEIPSGATIVASTGNFLPGEVYIEQADVICKVVHKEAVKYMSAFQVATEFFNPRSLTENHYLTFGYSAPDYLRNYPLLAVKKI
ncbi:MAG: hypothetical protein J6S85_16010 [Methanobrevibacter sp.]|nr:hypothetical protein [Methanobrevibacter sp.]